MFIKRYLFSFTVIFFTVNFVNAVKPEKNAGEIHERILTIDTHCDTPMAIVRNGFDMGKRNEPPESRVDFVRMKEGGLDAIFFAAFTGQKPRTPENITNAYNMAHKMIDATYQACNNYNDLAVIATAASDAKRVAAKGMRAIYIGMENGFPIGTSINRVKEFYDRGVRYITLCHSYNNDICDSSTDPDGPEHNGLSKFGEEVVKEMNKLGIIIDVSHISDESFFDVIKLSNAPVIASHSSVRAIAHHPRNMSDKMIKMLAEKGGVIQICMLDNYIKDPDTTTVRYKKMQELRKIYNTTYKSMNDEEKKKFNQLWSETDNQYPEQLPTVADMVDHIDYVKKLVGIDYVGIGSDFDGGGGLADCRDVSQFPNITKEMIKRGYTVEQIKKVWGANFLRVFKNVEKQARKYK
jgi:membrane dipeptidase